MTAQQRLEAAKQCSRREGGLEEERGGQRGWSRARREMWHSWQGPGQVGLGKARIFILNRTGSRWRPLSNRVVGSAYHFRWSSWLRG